MKAKRTQGEINVLWLDYTIEQVGDNFKIKGDTETELIDKGLYKPGDVFIVTEDGWLRKKDQLEIFLTKEK